MTDLSKQLGATIVNKIRGFITSRSGVVMLAALAAFTICLTHGVAKAFVYDANNYWSGAIALASGGDPYTAGLLDLRGALTVVIYLPAVLIVNIFGPAAAGVAVLVQNAILISVLGTIIIPGIVQLLRPIRGIHVWASAVICSALLSGFPQYPLMDLWAGSLTLLGLLLLRRSDAWWSLLLGGFALGTAINLRPACAVPALLAYIVWLIFKWRRGLWPVRGAILALLPQVLINHSVSGVWDPWPVKTSLLSALQSMYASFVVRYDTVAFAGGLDPRQAYCDPNYATTIASQPTPFSSVGLAMSYLHNLPSSIMFAAEKISASLHWSVATPYAYPAPAAFSILTPIVIVLTAVGFVSILRYATGSPTNLPMSLMLLAVWAGSVATIAFSQPETRFALPIVIIGVVGSLLLITGTGRAPRRRSTFAWGLVALVLAIAFLLLGLAGLAHPAPPGDVTALICSKT